MDHALAINKSFNQENSSGHSRNYWTVDYDSRVRIATGLGYIIKTIDVET